MPEELTALTTLYASFYRTAGDIERIAAQSGIDPSKLSIGNTTPATAWHMVTTIAVQESRMADMYAIIKKEHPGNEDLPVAWAAYISNKGDHDRQPVQQPIQAPPKTMSDNWRYYDVRIDALQKEVADLRTIVAELRTTLGYMINQTANLEKQNREIIEKLDKQHDDAMAQQKKLPHDLSFYAAITVAIALTVIFLIYYGGNIP